MQDPIQEKIEQLAKEFSLELVDLKVFSNSGTNIVRCLVDYSQGGVNLDECARLNRRINQYLETSGYLGQDYSVEVNSPGIDWPVKTYKDFFRNFEKIVCLWLTESVNGKAYWEGKIIEVNNDFVKIKTSDAVLDVAYSIIKTGKIKIN